MLSCPCPCATCNRHLLNIVCPISQPPRTGGTLATSSSSGLQTCEIRTPRELRKRAHTHIGVARECVPAPDKRYVYKMQLARVCIHLRAPRKEVCVQLQIARVCIHVPASKTEVGVQRQIAKVCIHVPAPKSEICVQEKIAQVCIHVPGPETEVCTNVPKP